ncbi:MAG: CinA family protein [Alphaproteobacteria bacterium]|nr:CinA family protein [Alphaproteobacteria bacterium]
MPETLFPDELYDLGKKLVATATAQNAIIATAESCTGGLLAGLITEISGASQILQCGFVTYQCEAKQRMLGVDADLIAAKGAVSSEVAAAMALGALRQSTAEIAVSITGLASAGGEHSPTKPVGLVYIGLACRKNGNNLDQNGTIALDRVEQHQFIGNRVQIRLACVRQALLILMSALVQPPKDA